MKIFAPKERDPNETRATLDPAAVSKLIAMKAEVEIESGLGHGSGYADAEYEAAGATVTGDRAAAEESAGIVLRISKPAREEIGRMKRGALHISFLDPFNEPDLMAAFAGQGVTAISLEMVPRTTLAQKMDALSSQASLAGYASVILAADRLDGILPMMMTPSGTISPAKFFVIGIGVAGLQAIATAKRLGARVTAFDVRPEALEQAESLGARALRIDLGDTGAAVQGYANQLTPEQLETQRQEQAKVCAQSDAVITTAKVFGRKPPILIHAGVVEQMRRGSVIVDLAAEAGGNVEGIVPGEEIITANGVRLVGLRTYEGRVPRHATQMLGANFTNMLEHFRDAGAGESFELKINLADEIQAGCIVAHAGEIFQAKRFQEAWERLGKS